MARFNWENKMKTLAKEFLENWDKQYENSEGAINTPEFSNTCEYSDQKEIPFQIFEDGSLVIAYKDNFGRCYYEHLDNDSYLDEEWDLEWSHNNAQYAMQNVWAK